MYTLAGLILAALLTIGLLWPILIVYAVHRFLRDFRRIANALEARPPQIQERPVLAVTPEEGKEARGRILNSAFGR
jgi:hypothetical protein